MDSANIDRRHLLAGMAATAAMISLQPVAIALPDAQTQASKEDTMTTTTFTERTAGMAYGFLEGD